MARAATTSDAFNAIAEPQRRDILVLLRAGERPVTDLAHELGMSQPRASKHLRVLREVGLVHDRRAGKQRFYDLDAGGLRPVHEWTGGFERLMSPRADREIVVSRVIGDGGEEGRDNDIARETFEHTGASVMGKRMFDLGERSWPDDAPFHTAVFVVTHEKRDPWERPGGTTFAGLVDEFTIALSPVVFTPSGSGRTGRG